MVTNRILLREQVRANLWGDGVRGVDVVNYQAIEKWGSEVFSEYSALVFDEAHYIFNDSPFNRRTDFVLDILEAGIVGKICIFISATPDVIVAYYNNFDYVYRLESDYSYIGKLAFFRGEDDYEKILGNLKSGEKCLCFCSSAEQAFFLAQRWRGAFICSQNNAKFYRYVSEEERQNLVKFNKFSSNILFTTKVLDSGVDIKDRAVTKIIIDMLDPITFIQCLGRRRILEAGERVELYVREHSARSLNMACLNIRGKIGQAAELEMLGREKFLEKYRKVALSDIIDNDISINRAKYFNYKYYLALYESMMSDGGYRKYICQRLKFPMERAEIIGDCNERQGVDSFLGDYVGERLYSSELEEFKEKFVNYIVLPKKTDYRKLGLLAINKVLKEMDSSYNIVSKVCKIDGRPIRCWIVQEGGTDEEVHLE